MATEVVHGFVSDGLQQSADFISHESDFWNARSHVKTNRFLPYIASMKIDNL